ncbi:ATP-grasp peptide maturase system methyltransferase [Nocardioides luteus]|uniref:Protein-L-isoaspartate O-methyltransferase n=1 Tax=Nocardioides luteus TaxID=1844 RepID=A0A1J4N552_9ACTN|nr:ATP-grasp peptide maturase system methyltransferase [Nocardioides luteus]OIJ25529.1 hypothetical protein UG56_017170 [Nocardioides luteus]
MSTHRTRLADTLARDGLVRTRGLRDAVATVPREPFLRPGVFLADETGQWVPTSPEQVGEQAWTEIAYRNDSLVTQLDGHLTVNDVDGPLWGDPTCSSTIPGVVTSMIDELDLDHMPDEGRVLEFGTGTGYSTALLATVLGDQRVASVELDPDLAARAHTALETVGLHPSTVTGDGLAGHPDGGPYDRAIATFAVRDIPHTWIEQVRPGGTIVATVGVWAYGTGLARLTVDDDATATGRLVRTSAFMPARAQATRYRDDMFTLAERADGERDTTLDPEVLGAWMPALLIQLALPRVHLTAVTSDDGVRGPVTYLVSENTASFAEIAPAPMGWHVRQGGPVAIWDTVEATLCAWTNAGSPGIESVQVRVDREGSTYWIGNDPALRWMHPA